MKNKFNFKQNIFLTSLLLLSGMQNVYANNSISNDTKNNYTGIETSNMDTKIRPQDDFYKYVNGSWLLNTPIPPDKSSWGSFQELRENNLTNLKSIIAKLENNQQIKYGTDEQKIADMYSSYMNESQIEQLGLSPIRTEMDKIDSITDKNQIPEIIAYLNQLDVYVPFVVYIHQDARDSTKMIVDLQQDGLGLPDRDYYLKFNDKKLMSIKDKYTNHIKNMLTLIGDKSPNKNAKDIVKFETKLAKIQWTKVENRNPIKTYNKVTLNNLKNLNDKFAWDAYLKEANLNGKISYFIISQPSYIKSLGILIQNVPLNIWKEYFKWQLLNRYAPLLPKKYVDENFSFYYTTLKGIPKQEPRWQKGIKVIENGIGEGLGKLYVNEYFPVQNKIYMEKLVDNLIETYRVSINELDWMSEKTKLQAQKKLNSLVLKIGYPSKWRDYSSLSINKNELIGNIIKANIFEYNRNLAKLGKPVDRTEWQMTPQTVNAYYDPELNEIVFPAAILQPPFFNIKADDAVNYGGIGAVIGHEISHAFDDEGSQYDESGNLRNWWTKEDHIKFKQKTQMLVKQYSQYSSLPGYNVNGELTLGENIADNSGLAITYKAYIKSLEGKPSPIINNTSGEQRLYEGFAQVWRGKVREAQIIDYIKTDPHSPPSVRGNGTLRNQDGYYRAFDVKPGDKMYLAPDMRVKIW